MGTLTHPRSCAVTYKILEFYKHEKITCYTCEFHKVSILLDTLYCKNYCMKKCSTMSLTAEGKRKNSKLSQLKVILQKDLIDSQKDIEWVFEKVNALNHKIKPTAYLQSQHPEWIGGTALHLAAHFRNEEAYRILLNKGADFTVKNNSGATALHIAIGKVFNETIVPDFFVHSVLSAHLERNNFKNPCNQDGLSHFHIACLADKVELVKQFLDHTVSINHAVNMESTSFPGYTPLHFAVEYRSFEVTKILLFHGANTQIKDARGMTPLHYLLKDHLENTHVVGAEKNKSEITNEKNLKKFKVVANIVRLLFDHYSDGDMIIDDTGLSQLHLSCTLRESKETECLIGKVLDINHSVDMNSLVWPGYTALHFAAHFDLDTVTLLLKNGANILAKDAKGVTPFDVCVRMFSLLEVHTIILLVPEWKNIALPNDDIKLSDLIFAMKDADCFEMFLNRLKENFHVHIPNDSPLWPGFSSMHIAVVLSKKDSSEEDQSMLKILEKLFSQAPTLLHHQEVHGWTPLHLAYRLQKDQVTQLLIKCHESFVKPCGVVDKEGLSYTHIASTTNNGFLEKLLSNGSNVNAVYKGTSLECRGVHLGSTPLHFAVACDSKYATIKLLEYQADVYAKDENGMTPIHLLATTRHQNYDFLLNYLSVNLPRLKDSVVRGLGLSHLHVACLGGHCEITKILIKNKADVHQTLTYEPITRKGLSCLNDWRGCTPAKIALERCRVDCLDDLILYDPKILVENHSWTYDILTNRRESTAIVSHLENDQTLQARLKADIGITACHLASWYYYDPRFSSAVDVNTQVRVDSPVWSGWTPVHVLLSKDKFCNKALDVFVEAGMDLMLANVDGDTALHMAYRNCCRKKGLMFAQKYSLMNKLLRLQKDFSINPTSINGMTHFHIACALGNTSIVEKFLSRSAIDVNQPIDFFDDSEAAGQTPLHLVARSSTALVGVSNQLQIVELLLRHGADVHAEDSCGNTVLHECARPVDSSIDLFERIAKEGADVNARNILGDTPLKYFLMRKLISYEEVERLLKLGCYFNAFNPITEESCLGQAIYSLSCDEIESLVSILKSDFSRLIKVDEMNRTIVHCVVSIMNLRAHDDKYSAWIEQLSTIGYDVDDQDIRGRTPLHMAVKFQNLPGVSTLLKAGTDVNLVDVRGMTAFDYCLCFREKYKDARNINLHVSELLATHVKKLLHCGLDVVNNLDETFHKSFHVRHYFQKFLSERRKINSITIESCSFSLSDLLTENTIIDYPRIPLIKRTSINEFFLSSTMNNVKSVFKETAGIFQLQYRKAVQRMQLVDPAKDSLTILAGFRMPDLCSEIILKLLKNSDLRILIASTNEGNNV